MTAAGLLRMVWQNIRRARREFVLSAVGIAIGIASLAFFLALSSGVRAVVLGRVFHVDRLELEPARSTLEVPLLGGLTGPAPITDAVVARIKALPGVRAVAPRLRLAFPAKAWGGKELLGQNRFAELLGDGVDPGAVAGERFGPLPFADLEAGPHESCNADPDCHQPHEYCAWDLHQCQKPVPVLVSRFLVELYNRGFAVAHGLPRISDFLVSRFRGFTFTVELGASYLGGASRGVPRQRRLMLVGVSDRAIPIGISVPLAYAQRWNREYAGEAAGRSYSSLLVEVDDRRAVTQVAAAARSLGLQVVDTGAEQAGLAITLVSLLFALVSFAILLVAALNIAHTFFRAVGERRREIGVLRAIGASARDVLTLLLAEAVAIGLVGGALGLALARLLAWIADLLGARYLPDFPFKPDTFFAFSPLLGAAVVLFAMGASVLGALAPAIAAARLEPAQALAAR